jgi:transcriptional antiterminator NusG
MDWYILQVHSGTEKKVEKELLAQLEKKGLKKNIDEILIPSEDVIEMKKGKKVNTERKFFPG